MTQKICHEYLGVACIDGTCPIANRQEYEERCIPTIRNCKECFYYEGCEDCYNKGTDYCPKDEYWPIK